LTSLNTPHSSPFIGFPVQIPQIPIVYLSRAIQTQPTSMPHPSDRDSDVHPPGGNSGQLSTYVPIYRAFPRRLFPPMVLISLFRICSVCGKPTQGAFVHALGGAFHLSCFTCMVYPPQISPIMLSLIPDRIVVMSSHPSSSQSRAQTENKIPCAREITSDDSTSCVESVEWP